MLPPASYEVEYWDGERWKEAPGQRRAPRKPAGRRANRVTFQELATTRIRVVLRHQPGSTSGLTELEAWSAEPLPMAAAAGAPAANLAWNPGDRAHPRVSASYTYDADHVEQAVDGRIAFTRYSRNRWSAAGSPNAEDWLEVDFGGPRSVGGVELYLFGDGRGLAAPRAYRVETWNGSAWVAAVERVRTPTAPTAWALNTVVLEPVETSRVRVVLTHDTATRSSLTELRVLPAG